MKDRTIAGLCAAGLFVACVALGLAGADKPPPLGFLWFVLLIALIATGALVELRRRLAARASGSRTGPVVLGLQGLAFGGVAALVLGFLGRGEPSVAVSTLDVLLGVAIASLAGLLIALLLWAVAAGLQTLFGRR